MAPKDSTASVLLPENQVYSSPKKVLEFRETRLDVPNTIKATATFYNFYGEEVKSDVINLSRFGVRIKTSTEDTSIRLNEKFEQAVISLDDSVVYRGSARIVNESAREDNTSFGVSLAAEGIDTEHVQAIFEIDKNLESYTSTKKVLAVSELVIPEFKILVADLNTLFQDLKYKLLQEESKIKQSGYSDSYRERMEEHAVSVAMSLYSEDIHSIFSKFKEITDQFSHDQAMIHKRYFRANFHPVVLGTPFINRAFTKPLGYAGDYGLMLMFYEYQDSGGNLFEKFFHRFSCNEPAAMANMNRVEFLSEILLNLYQKAKQKGEKEFIAATIACGPAREIELFLSKVDAQDGPSIRLVLIDQEQKALEFALARLRSLTHDNNNVRVVILQEDAVLGIIKQRPFTEQMKDCDCIISAGLFDYLSDRVAQRLIKSFYGFLKPDGMMYIGNVSTSNPDRFSMEYFMEWQLILRGEQELQQLAPESARSTNHVRVISESLGLNLFLEIQKVTSNSNDSNIVPLFKGGG